MRSIKRLSIDILIITIYVVLSLMLGTFSFGVIQIRIAECLQVVCLRNKHYIITLTIGCFITNAIATILGYTVLPLDIIFGTIATTISCCFIYLLRTIKSKSGKPYISLFMPVIINAVIIAILYAITMLPLDFQIILKYFLSIFISIFVSEFISSFLLGLVIYKPIMKILDYYESLKNEL